MPRNRGDEETHRAPAFVVADDDVHVRERLLAQCPSSWYYFAVGTGEDAVRYFREWRGAGIAAVLLSDTVRYYNDGDAAAALAALLREKARVVVLSEVVDESAVARWKERGATDCLPHPTRQSARMEILVDAMRDLGYRMWKDEDRAKGEGGTP